MCRVGLLPSECELTAVLLQVRNFVLVGATDKKGVRTLGLPRDMSASERKYCITYEQEQYSIDYIYTCRAQSKLRFVE